MTQYERDLAKATLFIDLILLFGACCFAYIDNVCGVIILVGIYVRR